MAAEMTQGATDAKKRRYDRQLRLWGEHGQAAMEECSICLLNGSATGTETLKNLVLPGVHSPASASSHRPHPSRPAHAPRQASDRSPWSTAPR